MEHYFEEKWHNEFENVKHHLEKAYQDKILEHERDLENKKGEISRRIESYLFLHSEDQKIITDLKQRIDNLLQEVATKKAVIESERSRIEEIKREILETEAMFKEDIAGI